MEIEMHLFTKVGHVIISLYLSRKKGGGKGRQKRLFMVFIEQ